MDPTTAASETHSFFAKRSNFKEARPGQPPYASKLPHQLRLHHPPQLLLNPQSNTADLRSRYPVHNAMASHCHTSSPPSYAIIWTRSTAPAQPPPTSLLTQPQPQPHPLPLATPPPQFLAPPPASIHSTSPRPLTQHRNLCSHLFHLFPQQRSTKPRRPHWRITSC